jgi:hypothetical protein
MLRFLMPHGFDSYRIFISAPGDLEPDRQACYDAIAAVNESCAMPAKILLASVGLRDSSQIESNRSIVSDNVRWSSYFIQMFQDDWGPRDLFRKIFLLSLECRDDAVTPMRDVVVCLKDAPHETNSQILAFRAELEGLQDVRLLRYSRPEEIRKKLEEVCTGWAESIVEAKTEKSPEA